MTSKAGATHAEYWQSLVPSAKGSGQDIKRQALIASGISATNKTTSDMEAIYWKNLA